MNVFARIRKVDEEKRLVFGRAAEEAVDKSGEIMDYMSSKPHFQAWSAEIAKDTGGKNLGNVRAMHGKVAAGGLTEIAFDDTGKTIDVCAKIVDDNEWKKVLAGTYTGFSIGGSYVGEKKVEKIDGEDVTRYTAKPNEISIVDRPCMKGAKFFEVQKADGTLAKVDFVAQAEPDAAAAAAAAAQKEAEELIVKGTADEVEQLAKLMNEHGLSMADVLEKIAPRKDASAKEGEDKYGAVKFADPVNKKYPIDTPEHIRAAWNYIAKSKNAGKYETKDVELIKSRIVAAWKDKIDKDGPPSAKDDAAKMEKAVVAELRKGMYACSSFASIIASLQSLKSSAAYEAYSEGDDSPLPARIGACIALCGAVLKEMIDEEISEMAEGTEAGASVLAMAEQCGALAKHDDGDPLLVLLKAGARHSAADADRLNSIHKAAVDMGADCPGGAAKAAATGELAKVDAGSLEKMVADAVKAASAPLEKALADATAKITKLEAQPATPRVSLRAIGKGADLVDTTAAAAQEPEVIKDDHGEAHEAASAIRQLHKSGGTALVRPLGK